MSRYSLTTWTNQGAEGAASPAQKALRDLTHPTGAPQKLYLKSPLGAAMAAVTFDGNDGIYAAKTDFGILPGNRTLIACARVRDGQTQGFLFDASSYSPGLTRAQVRSNVWQVSTSGTTNTGFGPAAGIPTATVLTNVWQTHTFLVTTNGGTPRFQHFTNGVLAANLTLATNGALSGLMIGANVSQQFGIRADVAEFLVFSSALDAATRSSVEAFLSNKWSGVVDAPNAPPKPAPFVPVFVGGQEGYACYRIPAMVTTTNGTVIAVADGRISNCGDIPNPLDLVMKRSFDNGRT